MKFQVMMVGLLMISANVSATAISYDCKGQWQDPENGIDRPMTFEYNYLDGSEGEEHQAVLTEAVSIDPQLTNEDTTGWTSDQLVNFKTNFLTTYSKNGCPNEPSVSPTKFVRTDAADGSVSVRFMVGCGDGFGDKAELSGSCHPQSSDF